MSCDGKDLVRIEVVLSSRARQGTEPRLRTRTAREYHGKYVYPDPSQLLVSHIDAYVRLKLGQS